ncbi:MAG: hypothetical protein ABR535_10310 [Pyrinomonadaceae bacterium]
MSRKKRIIEAESAKIGEKKHQGPYQDRFQQRVGGTIEGVGSRLEGHGRTLLYGLIAVVVLGVVAGFFFLWSGRSNASAQAALGKAIATSQARIAETPPEGSTEKTFKTEQERAQAAIAEFQTVSERFGGDVGRKAQYFAAVSKLAIDRSAATQELAELAQSNEPAGKLAGFALAQVKTGDGQMDEAAALYQQLREQANVLPSRDTIDFELAKIYEKQGKRQEAVDLLFNMVKAASEAKDSEGKPVPLSQTLQSAKDKLREIAPAKASEIPEPVTDSALGAAPEQ